MKIFCSMPARGFILILVCFVFLSDIEAQNPDSSGPSSKSKGWIFPAAVLAYSSVTYIVYRHADDPVRTYVVTHHTCWETTISRSVSDFGLGRSQAIGVAATATAGLIFKDTRLQKTSLVWVGSLLVNSVITQSFKNTFQRHRPNTGDPYNTFDWRGGPRIHQSFVSAHTSNIFTTATVFSLSYPDKKWVAPTAYGLATLVGLSRIYDNAHWASDVMAGALVGYLSARLVNGLYHKLNSKIHLLPEPGLHSQALSLVYRW